MAKGGLLQTPGRPALITEGRGRRGARMSLDSSWFDLDKDALIDRLLTFGYSPARAEREAQAFLDYRTALRTAPQTQPKPEAGEDLDEVARQWQDALRRKQGGTGDG